jgi:hypothetical protein
MWNCTKRWALEAALTKAGHRWQGHRARQPMSGAECLCRILAWLDQRSDPTGDISDCQPEDVELAAGWTGKEGALYAALVATKWVDEEGLSRRWHDYGSFNGNTIRDRNKKRGLRPGTGRGHRSDLERDEVRDDVGASGSGSGSGSGVLVPVTDSVPSERLSGRPDLHPLALAWNSVAEAEGLSKVMSMSPTRRRHAENRLKEADVETWTAAYRLIAHDPFCRGDNDRGWKADFDYAMRPEKCGRWLDLARNGHTTNGSAKADFATQKILNQMEAMRPKGAM